MNRPSFALTILLAALGGPLFVAGVARSESHKPVCTPPVAAVHPVDRYTCPLPCPGYVEEYGAAEADGLATAEDWQEFVTGEEKPLAKVLSDQYDDLFDTLNDAASRALAAIQQAKPAVVEADPSAYNADAPSVPKYEPYAEESADTVENDAAPAEPVVETTRQNSSIEAYESAFSGYGSTSYLQENYGYTPVKEFDLDKLVAARRISASTILFHFVDQVMELQMVADARQLAVEAHSMAQQLSCEYPFERLADGSEAAWDHIEEYQRLSARSPVPAVADYDYQGYRLPFDDCGWDGEYNWRRGLAVPAPAVQPEAPSVQVGTQRDALLTIARSLRNLAGQLDAASAWIAEIGGIDVAELGNTGAAR